jgi:hypothetical protein
MTLRHDARQCRERVKSERIRIAHGLLTPEEIQAAKDKAELQRLAQAKAATKGHDLFGGEA